ncbi:hypothetical protein M5U04_17065 [Xenorhabdus sp. XENO-1]|uniref:hypothetical protein n=1 Tax=Xenorhabdus bovienii TaxID=40576 RepID=UPI0020CA8847|nr:hypothetical protein [Xenorhabdus bovienii]MCP9269742.1 hypothetical protein [Xenorhabdus bovienii subsp. africana]
MGILTGNDTPTPGKSYVIHRYPIDPNDDWAGAVTVYSKFQATPGGVFFAHWEDKPLQRFECVEGRGYFGFICRAAPAGDRGAYLGYDNYEMIICKAQYQQKWEDMQVIKLESGGFKWMMRKDDHFGFCCISRESVSKDEYDYFLCSKLIEKFGG